MRVVIVGGGAAGMAAAIATSNSGAEVLLIESESTIGGELFSGLPILGAYTSRGEQCIHGVLDEIIAESKRIDPDGYIGPVCDWRTVYGLCADPEILRLAVLSLLEAGEVRLLLNTTVYTVDSRDGVVQSLKVVDRKGRTETIACDAVIDASGGGYITMMAGGDVLFGSSDGTFQPVSVVFRMAGVDFEPLLAFVRDNPQEVRLSENPIMGKTREEAAQTLYDAGYPYIAISAEGSILGRAIKNNEVHPCSAIFMTPTSIARSELGINATRVASIDSSDDYAVSAVLPRLGGQVVGLVDFLKKRIPGFDHARVSSVAHRVGVRESGRIVGEYTLTQNDVLNAIPQEDHVAYGAHHVDIHGSGTAQVRIPVKDGNSYQIPYRSLLPKGLKNVIAAGRCLSSDRGANGSARVMGSCISTGQAAGVAARLLIEGKKTDFRDVDPAAVREAGINAVWRRP